MTTADRKVLAKKLKTDKRYTEAAEHYKILQIDDPSDWIDYFLIQCYRHMQEFEKAWDIVGMRRKRSPSFQPIKNKILWLTYSSKIKAKGNYNIVEDAEQLLAACDINDKFTGPIFIKTVLEVIK